MTTHPDLPRLRAIFALDKLSAKLQSDLLADGTIAAHFDIDVKRPVRLAEDLALRQEDLFAVFRQASDGASPPTLLDENGMSVGAKISIEPDGAGIIETSSQRWRFEYAALLSSNPTRRIDVLESALRKHTMSERYASSLRALVLRPYFGNDDFIETVMLLGSSPESFAEQLLARVQVRQVSRSDLSPDDVRYWDHLAAPPTTSSSLDEYIDHELADARRYHLVDNSIRGFRFISMSFGAPASVPLAMLRDYGADAVAAMVEGTLDLDDHFALAGAFEVCADWLIRDPRFATLGDKVLDRLFHDMERLKTACGLFAAGFVVGTAYLAEHESLRQRPTYWRRLAAVGHASLIVRTCGVTEIKQEELVSWAFWVAGAPYYMSVMADMVEEPYWRPEWIYPNFLIADTFGRGRNAMSRLPDFNVPASWEEVFRTTRVWIDDQHLAPLTTLPAVLEGGRSLARPRPSEVSPHGDLYSRFVDDPSIESLLILGPLIHSLGLPADLVGSVRKVLELIRRDARGLDDATINAALAVSGGIAVEANDVSLADAIADICLEKAPAISRREAIFQCVLRLVECFCADTDREYARSILVRRLENLAFVLPLSELPADLADALEVLKGVDSGMAPLLGKALAAARLGCPRR